MPKLIAFLSFSWSGAGVDPADDDASLVGLVPAVVIAEILGQAARGERRCGLALENEDALQVVVAIDDADVAPDGSGEPLDGLREEIGARAKDEVTGPQLVAHLLVVENGESGDGFDGKGIGHAVTRRQSRFAPGNT
jgi:hypothetical protein